MTHTDLRFTDNDLPVITLSLDTTSASEGAGSPQVKLSATRDLSASSNAATVAVTIGTDASTATRGRPCATTDGCDYDALATTTLRFSANQTTSNQVTFALHLKQDSLTEGDETVVIGGAAAGFTVTSATFTINDDDTASTAWTLTLDTDPGAGTSTSLDEPRNAAGESATPVTVTATLDGGTRAEAVTVALSVDATSSCGAGCGQGLHRGRRRWAMATVDITIPAGSLDRHGDG